MKPFAKVDQRAGTLFVNWKKTTPAPDFRKVMVFMVWKEDVSMWACEPDSPGPEPHVLFVLTK